MSSSGSSRALQAGHVGRSSTGCAAAWAAVLACTTCCSARACSFRIASKRPPQSRSTWLSGALSATPPFLRNSLARGLPAWQDLLYLILAHALLRPPNRRAEQHFVVARCARRLRQGRYWCVSSGGRLVRQ